MGIAALYAGSFDPVTNGHLAIVRAALPLCDRLVIAVGVHHAKSPLLSIEDRIELIEAGCRPLCDAAGVELEVVTFDGLVVEAARLADAGLMVRGLRNLSDFDYEMQMAGMNRGLAPEVQTVFLPAEDGVRSISSSLVRQIAAMGGAIEHLVPESVAARMRQRLAGRGPGSDKREVQA
jgi:pantetheine-phosphate adenylyltransferase